MVLLIIPKTLLALLHATLVVKNVDVRQKT